MTGQTRARVTAAAAIAGIAGVVWAVLACGPFLVELKTVARISPGSLESYGRGELGIVRPNFARRFLVQAYRRMNGQPALPAIGSSVPFEFAGAGTAPALSAWTTLRASIPGAGPPPDPIPTFRRLPQYQTFENCLNDAFVSAAATLKARQALYGGGSAELRDWARAQDAVFANCGDGDLEVPEPAAPSAAPLMRADRAYQTAAAYFYAMRFAEAEKRFRAIADDAASPWRPYGRYLAARSAIRAATIPDGADLAALTSAAADLQQVLRDPSARALHPSAEGLLDFIGARLHPVERVRTLSKLLASSREVPDRQLLDYQRLMDRILGDTTGFQFDSIAGREALTKDDDLASWVLAMQGLGEPAFAHAVREWERRRSVHWLIAVLWKMPPGHSAEQDVLAAAARVPRDAPAAATVTFLRVRALARGGRRAAARVVLASAPQRVAPGHPADAINLFNAERFMLATTLGELLRSAPRMALTGDGDSIKPLTAVFDDDAGMVFSNHLPLARLVEASLSDVLPARLQLRVATAAFTRAVVLKRYEEALKLTAVLKRLAPLLTKDLDAFDRATAPDDRHRAAVLRLLRTPGIHASVLGTEDDAWFERGEAARRFDHTFRRNWWCAADLAEPPARTEGPETLMLVHGAPHPAAPAFLTGSERAASTRERRALAALGTAPNYLAREAVAWARARPQDLEAAEALALSVEGTRWGCTDERTTTLSRQAFMTLHRLFPGTEWARRTKYWY